MMEQGEALGIAKGSAEGRIEGEIKSLMLLLELKFGTVPDEARERIENATLEQLDRWLERVLEAENFGAVAQSSGIDTQDKGTIAADIPQVIRVRWQFHPTLPAHRVSRVVRRSATVSRVWEHGQVEPRKASSRSETPIFSAW